MPQGPQGPRLLQQHVDVEGLQQLVARLVHGVRAAAVLLQQALEDLHGWGRDGDGKRVQRDGVGVCVGGCAELGAAVLLQQALQDLRGRAG
jgi:hypothetical protein